MVEIFCVVGVAIVFVWGLVCNQRTYRQRMNLIDRRPHGHEFWAYSEEWSKVSYDRHLWMLMTFRGARKLYGPLTQKIWD